MSSIVYQCWVKAVQGGEELPKRGAAWIAARRGRLNFYSDRLTCGDWTIPFATIVDVVVLRYTYLLFFTAGVLRVKTKNGEHYYFGYNPWASPEKHLPSPPRTEPIKLGYSPLSLAIRIFLIGYVAYWLWNRYAS